MTGFSEKLLKLPVDVLSDAIGFAMISSASHPKKVSAEWTATAFYAYVIQCPALDYCIAGEYEMLIFE